MSAERPRRPMPLEDSSLRWSSRFTAWLRGIRSAGWHCLLFFWVSLIRLRDFWLRSDQDSRTPGFFFLWGLHSRGTRRLLARFDLLLSAFRSDSQIALAGCPSCTCQRPRSDTAGGGRTQMKALLAKARRATAVALDRLVGLRLFRCFKPVVWVDCTHSNCELKSRIADGKNAKAYWRRSGSDKIHVSRK